jgi:anti-sigma B factor antagonist
MAIHSRLVDDWLVIIKLSGELDAYLAPEVRERVEEVLGCGAQWVLMDLTEVEYIDSVGLGIMVGAAKRANERGGDLSIACGRPNVLRVFEISGTKELLNVFPTVAEARAVLEGSRRAAASSQGAEGGEA